MDVPTVVQNHPTRPTHASEQERQPSSPDRVPNLLLKILEACAKHKRRHEHDDAWAIAERTNEQNDKRHAKCQQDLQSLARVLPRVEPTICVDGRWRDEYCLIGTTSGDEMKIKEHSGEDDVRHLCALYRAIARGAFCPHAPQFLFGGQTDILSIERGSATDDVALAKGLLPRIMRLLGYLVHDPVRMATLPLRSNGEASLGERVNAFYQEEDIGATIASLLSLLQDVKLRISAMQDLINLANDLTTVEESGFLFDPLLYQTKEQNNNGTESKIRLHVFGELTSHFDKQSGTETETTLHLSSRRSLLSLQLGILTTLQHFVPLDGDTLCYSGKLTSGDYIDKVGLLNSLMATTRPVLQISSRTLHEDQTSGWVYSEIDANIHSRIILQTKLVVLGLLRTIVGSALKRDVELSLLAIEAVKSHAAWNMKFYSENSDFSRDEIERQLNMLCSWSISNLLMSTLLFPDMDVSSDDWVHTLPYLVDCIPLIGCPTQLNVQHECRVVLRILHAFLHRHAKAVTLFMNRCLAQGYFPYLFKMAAGIESVSGPAISIIVLLLESSLILRNTSDDKNTKFLCDALNSSPLADQNGSETQGEEYRQPIQHVRKRRRLLDDGLDNMSTCEDVQGTSIQSILVHFVKDATTKADDIIAVVDQRVKNRSQEGPKVFSLITQEDLPKLRDVSGVLMILLSLSALVSADSIENAIERLYTCIQKVSIILASHEKDGGICHIAPNTLKQVLSLLTRIGHHSYRIPMNPNTGNQPKHVSARESISYCVMATLSLIEDSEDSVKLEDDGALTEPENNGPCQHSCSRLCSVFGLKATPLSDICLCSLADHTLNLRLSRECESFLVDDVLPLECRSILLAALFPVTADSKQHDTTLTSVQRILADSSRSSLLRSASLVCLPTLFLSLASSKQDQYAASRYLLSIMKSFDFGLVANICQSDSSMLQVAAFLALTRVYQLYTAASLVASKQDRPAAGQLLPDAASLVWDKLDPSKSGIFTVLLNMLHFDEPFALLGTNSTDLPSSLNALLSSKDNLPLVHQSPRVFSASHLCLQSTLAVVPRLRLRSLGAYDFFRNQGHYSLFDRVAQASSNNEYDQMVIESIPAPVWVLLAPFVAAAPIARPVAENVGPALLRNECELFCAMFIDKETTAAVQTKEIVTDAVGTFFKQIEYLLISFFRLPHALILSSVEEDSSSEEELLNEEGLEIAVIIFKSLCQSSSLDLEIGIQVFQQSLLRLLRIWIGSTTVNYHTSDLNNFVGSPFSSFDAIKNVFEKKEAQSKSDEEGLSRQQIQPLKPIGLLKDNSFVASIFREFFLPCVKYSIPWLRYRILVTFIESCLLPASRTHGLPANGLDVPNNVEVVGYIDAVYPSIITALIFKEDIECLEMCAAFRMYLISEHKKQSKEEKRAQKRGINEFIVGTHLKKDRPPAFSRDLVPGVTIAGIAISTKKLTENMKLLCWKSDVIEYVLPRLLLHSDRSVLKFFADLCPPNISLSEILQRKEQTVLKTLVWELGADDLNEDRQDEIFSRSCTEKRPSRSDVILALKMGYLIKEGHFLMSASEKSTDAVDDDSARLWVGQNFMYLLVNIALHKWNTRSAQEKFQTMKCLKSMLRFLSPDESLQYMPQIIVAISNAMGSIETSEETEKCQTHKLRFVAAATLFDFVRILAAHKVENVGENLISIVVILFPLFDTNQPTPGDIAREEAVKLLVWLAENTSSYFSEIPFLPVTFDLQQVRDVLAAKKVYLDDIKHTSQQTDHEGSAIADPQLYSKFHSQMSILSELVATHESKQVRKVVIEHMTKLIHANRDLFHNMVENEGLASMHFLTVAHKEGGSEDHEDCINDGFVTKLLMRLLSRCVDETDHDIRDAIARCLGEVGAIDPNRLGKEIAASQFNTKLMPNDNSEAWRLGQPPWNSNTTRYELRLVTRHLVWGLKSANSTLDQHKIAFAIQELLKQIDASVADKSNEDVNHELGSTPMSSWLKDKLDEADVRHIVEPFWTSTYQQQELAASKKPPFFIKSNSYFIWLSSFSRFMVTKSHSNKKSIWKALFHSCRSAIRSQAGIGVAEFILPVLILDTICFGEDCDQDIVVSEILAALSFKTSSISLMDLREREKTVNAVFNVLDVIRHWMENEMEQMPPSPANKSKRGQRQSCNGDSWPVEESISKISHFIKRIPSSACAIAASSVGMNARALRFLEIESRAKCGLHIRRGSDYASNGTKYLKSEYIHGIDLELAQTLLGKLNDFDTMVVVTQKGHHRQSGLTRRLAEEAAERELYGDIEGSCQAYEQLLDTRLNKELDRLTAQKGLLRCLLKLGRLDSVINQAFGMSESLISARQTMFGISDEFLPSAAEAAWRLGNWAVLEKVSEFDVDSLTDASGRHQLSFGRVMHSVHCRSPSKFMSSIQEAREHVMASLSSAARDSYSQAYPHLQALHALRDVEIFFGSTSNNEIVSDEWRHRLSLSSPDFTGYNIIMNTRLALSRMSNEHIAEGALWLDTGKMARKGGLLQVAEQCFTHADLSFGTSICQANDGMSDLAQESIGKVKLQFAKLKYALGETTTALNLIEDDVPPTVFHLDDKELKSFVASSKQSVGIIGRLLLQATEWVVSGGLKSGTEIRSRYQTVLKLAPKWERAHFYFGKYLDTLYESCIAKGTGHLVHGAGTSSNRASAIGSDETCQRLLLDSVNHYGIALQLGQKHVYQALPRLLQMWLEFTQISGSSETKDQSVDLLRNQSEMNNLIRSFVSKIPEHSFYTALPQLISCILHNNEDSSRNVMHIITTVLSKYPRQAMWACNWLRFSKSDAKKKAGDSIFMGAKKCLLKNNGGAELQGMLDVSKELFNFLIGLAKHSPKSNQLSVKMKRQEFNGPLTTFIPPVQAALSVTPSALDRADARDIFPPFVPRIRAFNPELKIMQSKAKPKKVSMYAVPSSVAQRESLSPEWKAVQEDTGEMHFLVKQEAKGDLRKDSRVQDLNNVINRLFAGRKGSSGSDSRRKRLRLHLRTFSVVCLAEDCGILEWVPNTDSLRSLVGGTYNPQVPPNSIHRRGERITNFNNIELRDSFLKCQDMYFKKGNLIGAAKKFDENILQQYLPIMYWWFIQNFSNPHAWFEARNNFTLSTAVWSAVGHIIGLGDRHSENILLDTRSGECVHVDFDCIFDKGLLLPRPEVIPFRLTPNMIDAFGPTGSDGLYTGALVESMKTLRQNRDTLLSVLEPFLKDPVINFSSSKNQQKSQGGSAKAVESIRKIDGRLKGMYNLENPNYKKVTRRDGFTQDEQDDSSHVALSVVGQVQRMIREATSHENLVQVYVGWMPWI